VSLEPINSRQNALLSSLEECADQEDQDLYLKLNLEKIVLLEHEFICNFSENLDMEHQGILAFEAFLSQDLDTLLNICNNSVVNK